MFCVPPSQSCKAAAVSSAQNCVHVPALLFMIDEQYCCFPVVAMLICRLVYAYAQQAVCGIWHAGKAH